VPLETIDRLSEAIHSRCLLISMTGLENRFPC
jgi:hypothetical protein